MKVRVTFTLDVDRDDEEDLGLLQEEMDDAGADAIMRGLREYMFGNSLRDVLNVSVSEDES